ncbi:MAG: alternative ribosome rescue aminoacyl-tRNA hydrolase ArfB [Stenotrophobium sp.]
MLQIIPGLAIDLSEIELSAIRAQGAGGQNLHKTSTAAHLRFDIRASSLTPECQQRLRDLPDRRISRDGIIVIKAQRHRSLDANRDDALQRLAALIRQAVIVQAPRKATRTPRAAKTRRVDDKTRRGRLKTLRRNANE